MELLSQIVGLPAQYAKSSLSAGPLTGGELDRERSTAAPGGTSSMGDQSHTRVI